MKRKGVIWSVSDEEFLDIVDKCVFITDILSYFGLNNVGNNNNSVRLRMIDCGVDIDDFKSHSTRVKKNPNYRNILNGKIPLSDILIENSTYLNTSLLKKRLLEDGLINNSCYICGMGAIWNDKPISLQLDHINGNRNDNRLENLRLLCPNCHSQTETFSGKVPKERKVVRRCSMCNRIIDKYNKSGKCRSCVNIGNKNSYNKNRRAKRPSKNVLLDEIAEWGYSGVGRKYGVSDNAIRKWMKNYNI